jgi:hypothetical protein
MVSRGITTTYDHRWFKESDGPIDIATVEAQTGDVI